MWCESAGTCRGSRSRVQLLIMITSLSALLKGSRSETAVVPTEIGADIVCVAAISKLSQKTITEHVVYNRKIQPRRSTVKSAFYGLVFTSLAQWRPLVAVVIITSF